MSWMDGCKPTPFKGIWSTETGFRVRARATDPHSGAEREANRHYEGITLRQALVEQEKLRDRLRTEVKQPPRSRTQFAEYATSLFERKLAKNELKSAKSRERWKDTLVLHLVPHFGTKLLDQIKRVDVEAWLAKQTSRRRTMQLRGKTIDLGPYSPTTINGWLSILLTVLREAKLDLELEHDPTAGVRPLDTSTAATYTEEQPNSLTTEELQRFLGKARVLYPQHFAMLALGFATGRRPSELRALRRQGPEPDVLWETGEILIRRSVTLGRVMERTKTGRRLRIPLPAALVDILRDHAASLRGEQAQSNLLFPSETGGFRAASVLDKPMRTIAKACGIKKRLSARCMRRTFQDMGRAAGVEGIVVRAISGHATLQMQDHYSTVNGSEIREGLDRLIRLAGIAPSGGQPSGSGDVAGTQDPENAKLNSGHRLRVN